MEWVGHVEKIFEEEKRSSEEADEILGQLVYGPKPSPRMIKNFPRFHTCLKALWNLFEQEEAHVVLVMKNVVCLLLYGFAHASGPSFDSTFFVRGWYPL